MRERHVRGPSRVMEQERAPPDSAGQAGLALNPAPAWTRAMSDQGIPWSVVVEILEILLPKELPLCPPCPSALS